MLTRKTAYHDVPPDLQAPLESEELDEQWNSLTDIQRNEWVCWITIPRQQKTRDQHLKRAMKELKEGKRSPCCWPGCPHRNPNSAKWFKTKTAG